MTIATFEKLYSIPGKLETSWCQEASCVVDTWTSYSVSLDEFKKAVMENGLEYAKVNKGVAWIVDSSTAKGVFSQEIQEYIGSEVFAAFAENGIKYFITITSQVSAITKMTVSSYSSQVGPNGIRLVEADSVENAIEWLKLNQ